jgi:hypothetical protein
MFSHSPDVALDQCQLTVHGLGALGAGEGLDQLCRALVVPVGIVLSVLCWNSAISTVLEQCYQYGVGIVLSVRCWNSAISTVLE